MLASIQIPGLDSSITQPCVDPGVPDNGIALVIIAEHRRELAKCENKRAAAVKKYNAVRGALNDQGRIR